MDGAQHTRLSTQDEEQHTRRRIFSGARYGDESQHARHTFRAERSPLVAGAALLDSGPPIRGGRRDIAESDDRPPAPSSLIKRAAAHPSKLCPQMCCNSVLRLAPQDGLGGLLCFLLPC